MKLFQNFLSKLGVFGFSQLELIILAALISEEPLLLIGKSGTGKTFLLNRISEALGLEHRHYNSSYLSFDDLIGFPMPDENNFTVRFLQTPATIWGAESVLVDELSRCKPETQNKFFSIIHEKRIQGISLTNLRFRWAAMNPVIGNFENSEEEYEGSISMDAALADRFAFLIEVPDWKSISEREQELIIQTNETEIDSEFCIGLSYEIARLREKYIQNLKEPEEFFVLYTRFAAELFVTADIRISPRRARTILKNLIAVKTVIENTGIKNLGGNLSKYIFMCLKWSLPQRAMGIEIEEETFKSVHSQAFSMAKDQKGESFFVYQFLKASLIQKFNMLRDETAENAYKTIAVIHFMRNGDLEEKAVFAFSYTPFFLESDRLEEEALAPLLKIYQEMIDFDVELTWDKSLQSNHSGWTKCQQFLASMDKNNQLRKKLARKILLYLIKNNQYVENPAKVESFLFGCMNSVPQIIPN